MDGPAACIAGLDPVDVSCGDRESGQTCRWSRLVACFANLEVGLPRRTCLPDPVPADRLAGRAGVADAARRADRRGDFRFGAAVAWCGRSTSLGRFGRATRLGWPAVPRAS